MAIKIYIDQGHNPTGYPNAGASWYGQDEQDITYAVGVMLAEMLRRDGRFEVMLSRPTPRTVVGIDNGTSLSGRVDAANTWPADYFISIHANASLNTEAQGTECEVFQEYTQAQWLGEHISSELSKRMGTQNHGVKTRPNLYVLKYTKMPAVLVEMAYMSNPIEAEKLSNDRYGFAQGIFRGVLKYFFG